MRQSLHCTVYHCTCIYCTELQSATQCCTVLIYSALYCHYLHCILLYYTYTHCTALHSAVLYRHTLHCNGHCWTVLTPSSLHSTALYWRPMHCTMLHITDKLDTVPFCSVLDSHEKITWDIILTLNITRRYGPLRGPTLPTLDLYVHVVNPGLLGILCQSWTFRYPLRTLDPKVPFANLWP